MKLKGKVAIITGASQGLGFAIAKEFINQGASIMICARNEKHLYKAEQELAQLANGQVKILAKSTDISKIKEVEALVASAVSAFGRIDALVANAGVYGTKGPIDEVDWEEWSQAIDINLKGTVLQCRAVLPYFKKQQYGKIIMLSGGGATKPMPFLSAYAASKAALVRFAETLAEEVLPFNIDVNTMAPGALNTRLLDEILSAGPDKIGTSLYSQAIEQKNNGGNSLKYGASLCTFLASSESDGITGKLISAIWDPWEKLPSYLKQLKKSDIYTLRRIVPQDRNVMWDE